jgi:hypothetical protein
MIARLVLAGLLAAALFGCGVKTDLEPPDGAIPHKDRVDPSRPPQPIGQ